MYRFRALKDSLPPAPHHDMSSSRGASESRPVLPPKPQKSASGLMSKLNRKKNKQSARTSQYVDPQIISDEPDSADNSRLDVIDQLDISGLTGGTRTYHNIWAY